MRNTVLRTFAATGAFALALGLAACSSSAEPGSGSGGDGAAEDILVGVAMPTETSERWIADGDAVKSQLEELGYEVDLQFANDDIPRQQQQLESGIATLASIGSVAPYVGLFGTVWGIMNAFLGLSQNEQASIATVAPGIAEALIATAMGLFAAIPAVLAYNHFTAKSSRLYDSRALFCDEMTGMLQRETSTEHPTVVTATTQVAKANQVAGR